MVRVWVSLHLSSLPSVNCGGEWKESLWHNQELNQWQVDLCLVSLKTWSAFTRQIPSPALVFWPQNDRKEIFSSFAGRWGTCFSACGKEGDTAEQSRCCFMGLSEPGKRETLPPPAHLTEPSRFRRRKHWDPDHRQVMLLIGTWKLCEMHTEWKAIL